uniref:Zn(2)-C6 fungal-type domain-containing protein n=1 Tax=Bionectria ochroleuca TaxID=29856 RepID=A0A0B7JQA1_BIOOC
MDNPQPTFIKSRIGNACDGCKKRKAKCDGQQPCSFCVRRRRPELCHYSPQKKPQRRRRQPLQAGADGDGVDAADDATRTTAQPAASAHRNPQPQSPLPSVPLREGSAVVRRSSSHGGVSNTAEPPPSLPPPSRAASTRPSTTQAVMDGPVDDADGDTEVPREARLLCDAEGKLIFIGDCAPLSFFQSVRQLVTNRVGPNAFAPETSRGLVDLFDEARLVEDLLLWANIEQKPHNLTSILNYLVLAIGRLKHDQQSAQVYFEYARDEAWKSLNGKLGVGTIQAFILITVYMLCSCQINSAFLVFGVAVRAAHSIGVHRTEVNARFGPEIHRQRDRLWKSLRVVDLFLSASMGRPPSTSDVDCTVPYKSLDQDGNEVFDLLNASVQILLILECIVLEIYSRKKISLQLTEGISLQLRDWSSKWLQRLKNVIANMNEPNSQADVVGACQVLSSYYYAVMLVSRPFLMYELVRRLSDNPSSHGTMSSSTLISGKSKLADACIDAASLMVDPVLELIDHQVLNGPVPLLVSWLFASSLVLGVGLLGGFGRILEKYTRMSIRALDHFSQFDTHATQYSLIAQSLLTTALEHLEKRELQERLRRTESSSQLFGLMPHEKPSPTGRSPIRSATTYSSSQVASPIPRPRESVDRPYSQQTSMQTVPSPSPRFGNLDSAFMGLDSLMPTPDGTFWMSYLQDNDQGSALNLFPLLDAGGGIDLAHHL